MMYISRLSLGHVDMMRNRIVDDYGIHQLAYRLFPDSQKRNFLYFVDHNVGFGNMKVLIQSPEAPVDCGIGRLEIKEIPEDFFNQDRYWFRIRVNPVAKSGGKVIRIEGRTSEAVAWLCRRADKIGVHFAEDTIDKESGGIIQMRKRRDDKSITISYVDLTGILEVVDRKKFLDAVMNGVGGHKGFGFGLFQLRPLNI